MKVCSKCKTPITAEKVFFRDECPRCGSDIHVCLNCLFYDEGKSNKCRETQADFVKEKDRSNYCDYFRFNDTEVKKSERDEAEKLWKEFFKKNVL